PYGEGTDKDKHTAEEAAKVTVVNITESGTYRLSGRLSHGQIRVDLGKDADEDKDAVVTLVLDGLDINCDVAPAVVFMNVYECDGEWDKDTATSNVDTTDAGENVIIADGSTNNIEGADVAKIFKDNDKEKKLWKQDAAFYSYMSMNISGEAKESGVLNIKADNEGIGTELHLTINSGNINVFSANDGINTNEDEVSVTTMNGGNLHIVAGLGDEGDGIDSNGWLVINGGTVVSAAKPISDSGLDSSMGSFVNGGTVIALGSTMDWAESDSKQVTMNLQFDGYKEKGSSIIVTKEDGSVVFAYDSSKDTISGENTREFMGAVISCPNFAVGESYNVYIGSYSENTDSISGNHTNGVYDVSTVTAVNGVQQAYSGTDVGFGGFGGGRPPMGGNFDPSQFGGNMGEMPQFGGEMPQFGGERPQFDGNTAQMPYFTEFPDDMQPPPFPEGNSFDPEIMKPVPEGFEKPTDENGNPIGFGGEGEFDFNGEKAPHPEGEKPQINTPDHNDVLKLRTAFYMQDKVNSFSGVADYIL
ncbi:MAG: carbohydrate-binding domain-containing protein, partial [Oscillospiraceae bacterium]|nr:carbohydrate-binding domain-containing protein [Oscillospiraceae bacterium]